MTKAMIKKIKKIEREYQEYNQDLHDRLEVEARKRRIAERERDEAYSILRKKVLA